MREGNEELTCFVDRLFLIARNLAHQLQGLLLRAPALGLARLPPGGHHQRQHWNKRQQHQRHQTHTQTYEARHAGFYRQQGSHRP